MYCPYKESNQSIITIIIIISSSSSIGYFSQVHTYIKINRKGALRHPIISICFFNNHHRQSSLALMQQQQLQPVHPAQNWIHD